MKHFKTVTLGCTLALSMAPLAATAFTAEHALNACAEAVVKDLGNGEVSWRLDEDSSSKGRLSKMEMIHLDLRDASTDEVVARADCVVDSRARVRRVIDLPLEADDAMERSLSAY